MKSCLYECRVSHQRFSPRAHRFDYGVFFFCLDLNEIDEIAQSQPLIKKGGRALYNFCDGDFIDSTSLNIRDKVLQYVVSRSPELAARTARIRLLTSLRILGYIFNPVSIYYCLDSNDRLICAVAEVTNTFRESKLYFISDTAADSEGLTAGEIILQAQLKKFFYVSPFSNLDTTFQFSIKDPEQSLNLIINTVENAKVTLASSVVGHRVPLNTGQLLRLTLQYPLMSLRTITLIHLQAFKLYLKGVPFFAKEADPQMQTEVRNPHKSLHEHGSGSMSSTSASSYSFMAPGLIDVDKSVL